MLIPTTQNVRTITDMREDALGLLNSVDEKGLTYIFHRSQPRAVLLNINDFVALQTALEDLQDMDIAKKLSVEKRGKGIPLSVVSAKYV